MQDNETAASRTLGQATFTSLTTFLQGNVSSFQVVPTATELGWRSLFGAWYVEDAIKVRRNLTIRAGLRHEFTTGWNEDQGRAANYVTRLVRRTDDQSCGRQFVYTQNNAKLAIQSPSRPGVGCFRKRKDGGPRGIRDILFAD